MASKNQTRIFTDQTGRSIVVSGIIRSVVSLVPSQTELLYDLGAGGKIAGQTIFCVHPETAFKTAVKIGGTKKLNIDKIKTLQPDLIVANKEENDKAQIEILASEFPVWISDVLNLHHALAMIRSLGEILDCNRRAEEIASGIEKSFEDYAPPARKRNALYMIWYNPWMAAGKNTFISTMLELAGFHNSLSRPDGRYPELSEKEILEINPEIVLLSSEPFPFKQSHMNRLQTILPHATIIPVNGEMFSWYGSRLLQSAGYFRTLFNEFLQ